tara:strand:- start:331 stop:675 length:345 start_codon:yes stop_codon:yes gene_type:complete
MSESKKPLKKKPVQKKEAKTSLLSVSFAIPNCKECDKKYSRKDLEEKLSLSFEVLKKLGSCSEFRNGIENFATRYSVVLDSSKQKELLDLLKEYKEKAVCEKDIYLNVCNVHTV